MTTAAAVRDLFPAPVHADAASLAVAQQPDEAVFCFSAAALKNRARLFIDHFPGTVSYAVKCNPSSEVLSTLAKIGLTHWDVASVHEMKAVRAISNRATFHYHNPVKSRREIEDAYRDFGCRRFAVDCREEVQKITAVVGEDRNVEMAVRFVLPRDRASSAHDFSTKFGAPEHTAVELLKMIKALGFAAVLTFHPGSQSRDPQVYVRHIEAAARISKLAGVRVATLNVGGGFPANYEFSIGPEPQVFFRAIEHAVAQNFGPDRPALECEPGRGMVATCMSLLTRIKLVCSDGDDLFINDGVYGGLMEVMQVPDLQPPARVLRNGATLNGDTKSWKVFGPTCDPLDVLPRRLDLAAIVREGDYVEFGNLGAYGLATRTRFNGYGDHDIVAVENVLTMV